jgi:hypothetical protein
MFSAPPASLLLDPQFWLRLHSPSTSRVRGARQPVDMWTTKGRCPHTPQAQQAKASLNLSTKEGKHSAPLPVPRGLSSGAAAERHQAGCTIYARIRTAIHSRTGSSEKLGRTGCDARYRTVAIGAFFCPERAAIGDEPQTGGHMPNAEHVRVIRGGPAALQTWSDTNPGANLDCGNADLSWIDLRGRDLRSVGFFQSNLSTANLQYAILDNGQLTDANLTNARLDGASIRRAQ